MNQKWNLQDIRPAEKKREIAQKQEASRQQQDIAAPVPKHRRPQPDVPEDAPQQDYGMVDIVDSKSSKRKRIILFTILGIIILGVGYFISVLMGGASVTVHPKYKDTTVQATFTAYKKPPAGELSYELMTLDTSGEKQVTATSEEQVSQRATGDILIYNAYSKTPQRLIKNTRFKSPDGLIYRIEESVEVPGMTVDESGNAAPGVVTAKVFADGTGDQYNIGPTKFTIPGLEGSDQYDKMYAESTNGFTGGYEGPKYIIPDSVLQEAKQALHLDLRNQLLGKVDSSKPAGFILYKDAVTFTYESLPSVKSGDNLVTLKEHARLQVPIFKDSEFASYIAKNTVAGFESAPVLLPDPYSLTFSYASATTSTSDISALDSLDFTLTGQTRIVWQFDENALKKDLTGMSKTALPTVLSGYPAIDRAEAVIRPFWKQSFPDNPDDITITTQIGNGGGG
jgi:hypothetical protein